MAEVLHAYGLIESQGDAKSIAAAIQELLRGPQNDETYQRAHAIFSDQFEDIFAEASIAAIEALSRDDYVGLLVMAAKSSRRGFFEDVILGELIRLADRRALPAYLSRLATVDMESGYLQDEVRCYFRAVQGCARFLTEPPQFFADDSQAADAWRCYAEIFFWLCRPALTPTEMRARCAPLWQRLETELLLEAVDPLQWLSHASVMAVTEDDEPHLSLGQSFPQEIRRILERALGRHNDLTSLFRFDPPNGRLQYIINALGDVGDLETVQLLEEFVDESVHGAAAVAAIRRLNERAGS
jgi:hypothetical protein